MAAEFTLGVIGVGNMGGALVRGMVRAGAVAADQIVVSDAQAERAKNLAKETGVRTAAGNAEVASRSKYVLLLVKPGTVQSVVEEIAEAVTPEQTVVSFAAGIRLAQIKGWLGAAAPALVRVMPNTPALVGAGMFGLAAPGVEAGRVEELRGMLATVGRVAVVTDELMDAVTGLSGSGPAFVFLMIEALADGGVAAGLPRSVARELAVQTVAGAAKMVQDTGQHPAALKDAVASPGGTTMAGLAELERLGFRNAVLSAVVAAARRSRELSGGR